MRVDGERCGLCECDVCRMYDFGDVIRIALCDCCHEAVVDEAIIRIEIEREVSARISEVMQ